MADRFLPSKAVGSSIFFTRTQPHGDRASRAQVRARDVAASNHEPMRALGNRHLLRNCGYARRLGTDGTMLHEQRTPDVFLPIEFRNRGRHLGLDI